MFCEHNSKARKPGLCAKCQELKPYTTFKYCKTQCFNCKECGWFYGSGAPTDLVGRPATFGTIKLIEKAINRFVENGMSIDHWENEGGIVPVQKEIVELIMPKFNMSDLCKRCDIWHCKDGVDKGPTLGWCPKQQADDDEKRRAFLAASNQHFKKQPLHNYLVITKHDDYWEFDKFGDDSVSAHKFLSMLLAHKMDACLTVIGR